MSYTGAGNFQNESYTEISNRTICLWIISFEAPDLNIFVELRPILAALHPELVIDRQRINNFCNFIPFINSQSQNMQKYKRNCAK